MKPVIQQGWAAAPLARRLHVLRRARHAMAEMGDAFAAAISPMLQRTPADTLAAELLPLLDACKFLEQNAEAILKPRTLGATGRPLWLGGVAAEIRREPMGHVVVIGPANFPLFLPGVPVLQALAAGNAVTWKPGTGGRRAADLVAGALRDAGLPSGVLAVTDDTVDAGLRVLSEGADKVIFTGSLEAGKDVLSQLADTATPAVMELSGADAVIVLPSADLARVAKAIAFGLRLNGAAVCMSPRRLLALGDTMTALRPLLERELATVEPVALPDATAAELEYLLAEAVSRGARLIGQFTPGAQRPILVDAALPTMKLPHASLFAPVLSLFTVSTIPKFPDVYSECSFSLTVAIFGDEKAALATGKYLRAGTLLINDLIVPTADPRVPFGGRGASGFGATRGAEGLLEMTAPKTVLVRRGRNTRHYEATGPEHAAMFDGMLHASHARSWSQRFAGIRKMMTAGKNLR